MKPVELPFERAGSLVAGRLLAFMRGCRAACTGIFNKSEAVCERDPAQIIIVARPDPALSLHELANHCQGCHRNENCRTAHYLASVACLFRPSHMSGKVRGARSAFVSLQAIRQIVIIPSVPWSVPLSTGRSVCHLHPHPTTTTTAAGLPPRANVWARALVPGVPGMDPGRFCLSRPAATHTAEGCCVK